jgi:anti-sigma regulatory factor (Ser/Thr protein kinase)
LFYDDDDEYLDGIMRFIGPAVANGEPVAAAVPSDRARLLRSRLNASADRVQILDMAELGRNPARIIPEVEGMLRRCGGSRLHYVGQPIWAGRSQAEIREATRQEALINLAWPGAPISVLCPYDAAALSSSVLADAERTHPHLIRGGRTVQSEAYRGPAIPQGCDEPLPAPPPGARAITIRRQSLSRARALVAEVARRAGLSAERSADLLLVASELGANAIRHGRGGGTLHVWSDRSAVSCQVEDRGHITDPLAGRRLPEPMPAGGLGLWAVHQLCDLVEARTSERGTTVRARIALGS